MRFKSRSALFFAIALLASLAGASPAQEPPPFVPDAALPGRFADDFTLRYCIDRRDPSWEVDQAIAEAIAGALLVEPAPTVIEDPQLREPLDRLYTHLLQDCALYFGFKLLAGVYPDWLTVTRPYYEVGYLLVVRNSDWQNLADMPRDEAIGPTLGTAADFRLIQYLNSLPGAERWPRHPQVNDGIALDGVLSGQLGAALIWGPSFNVLQKADPKYAELRAIAPDPLPDSNVPVGAVLLNTETFLRSSVDEAIASLIADGTIASILAEHGFPATVPQ